MKNIDYSNQIQKEAILNECKGNLFEFLVTQELAKKCSLESEFLLNLPIEFKAKLGSYQELIRSLEPKLQVMLPKLASKTADHIWNNEDINKLKFTQWNVIGKMVANNDNLYWNETDIVGTYTDHQGMSKNLALSLKLTKSHSYTNTKSAGVKSFLIKYFGAFDGELINPMQNELNHEVDESFLMMGYKLYKMADLEFQGSFNSEWSSRYSELPGALAPEMREVVHENYHRVALKLAYLLNHLKKINKELFFESLYALCGFGHEEIIQVNCFHQDYVLQEVTLKNFGDIFKKTNKECHLLPIKDLASSIEVQMGDVTLQIRVKPMNKFTTAAYKINCSIKVKS